MRALIHAKYDGHLGGHKKVDLIHEVFGGVAPRTLNFLIASVHDMRGRDQPGCDPSDPDSDSDSNEESSEPPTSGASGPSLVSRSLVAHTLQAISISIHSNVADQVIAYANTIRDSRDLSRPRMDARGGF